MLKQSKFSKALHIATFCCFLLPFFYTGCGKSEAEKEASEKASQDSLVSLAPNYNQKIYGFGFGPSPEEKAIVEKNIRDSITAIATNKSIPSEKVKVRYCKNSILSKADTSLNQESIQKTQPIEPISENKPDNFSEIISDRLPFLKPVLVSKENIYSGIAIIIDLVEVIPYLIILVSFLLLVLSFIVKFIDKSALKSIVMLNFIALISLFFSRPASLFYETLWGFWIAYTFVFTLTVYDFYIMIRSKRKMTI